MGMEMAVVMQVNNLVQTGPGGGKKDLSGKMTEFGKVMQDVQGNDVKADEGTRAQDVNLLSILAATAMPVVSFSAMPAEVTEQETEAALAGVLAADSLPSDAQEAKNALIMPAAPYVGAEDILTGTAEKDGQRIITLQGNAETSVVTGSNDEIAFSQVQIGANSEIVPNEKQAQSFAGASQANVDLGKLQTQVAADTGEKVQPSVTEQQTFVQPTVRGQFGLKEAEGVKPQQIEFSQQMMQGIKEPVMQQAQANRVDDVSTEAQSVFAALQDKMTLRRDVPLTKAENDAKLNEQVFTGAAEKLKSELPEQTANDEQFNAQSEAKPEVKQSAAEILKTAEKQPLFAGVLEQQGKVSEGTTLNATQETARQSTSLKDPYQVVGQIVNQAKLINFKDRSEMVIKLNPEHLGEMTLRISIDKGGVSAAFHTDNSEVRRLLENSMTQLRTDLANQGFKVDSVDIYAGLDHSLPDGQNGQGGQQREMQQQNRKPQAEQTFFESMEEFSRELESDEDGVDYRV